ncbi:MAG TPA: hypothetical protein DF613_14035 [Lachnospiraceae bacterium]|nr:hypothetical protein [Lachnospiraceae bacterium]
MMDMETSKPLDKAISFNRENIFEYLEFLLHNLNADLVGEQAEQITQDISGYIKGLPLEDAEAAMFEINSCILSALCQTSHYAYRAGFMEACRLKETLRSF